MVKTQLFIFLLLLSWSCEKSTRTEAVVAPSAAPPAQQVAKHDQDPTTPEILKRPQATQLAYVKQILVTYDKQNPRFPVPKRTISEAISKVKEVLGEHKKGVSFDELMKKHSDDPETGPTADSLFMEAEGTPGSTRQLALRLAVGEVGVVETGNAFHIMLRVPDPVEVASPDSKDILAREPLTRTAAFKSLNLAWRGLKQRYLTQITEGALNRSQAQAAQLALDVLARVKAGGSLDDLITQYGEKIPMPEESHAHQWVLQGMKPGDHAEHGADDHAGHDHDMQGPADDHAGHDHGAAQKESGLREVPEVGSLSLRLQVGEAGIVTSRFGYHVVLRVR